MKISKLLSILLVLALLLCLLPASALADPEDGKTEEEESTEPIAEEEEAAAPEEEEEESELPVLEEDEVQPLVNGADETCYPLEGETVYNNGGTVYNNGALVYNNGGTVYNNEGTVYNNGGIVYANGGIVYNNCGTVYRNNATVYTFADDVQQSRIYGAYRVSTAEDYSTFAELEGLDENGMLPEGEGCTIRIREGVILRSVEADAGVLTENEDGSWTLTDLDADTVLTLEAQAEAPVFDLAEGCYGEAQTLTITGPQDAEIYYTLDGDPLHMERYEEPLTLSEGCTVIATAMLPGVEPSETSSADYAFVSITVPELPNGTQGEEPPEAVAFTVDNPGKIDAVIESVSLPGKSATYFSLSTEEGGTVKAGQSDSKTWTLRPAANLTKGNYKATVIFTLAGGQTVQCEIPYKVK